MSLEGNQPLDETPVHSAEQAAHHGANVGMALFLAALTMLFASSLLGYVLIRFNSAQSPQAGAMQMPVGFWFSTAILLAGSLTMHLAVKAVRARRPQALRRALLGSLALALAFVLVQTPSMVQLLHRHQSLLASGTHLYGMIFFLVLLHALHVIGGIASLAAVTLQAYRGRYDHAYHLPVRFSAFYWHFLDLVWLVMFGTFLFMG